MSVSMLLDLPMRLRSLAVLLLRPLNAVVSISCRWLSKDDEPEEEF